MSKLDTLEPNFRAKVEELIAKLKEHGINCVVTSGLRSIQQQNMLYAQGRTSPGQIVTKAKGGESPHNFALAADLCPLDKDGKLWWMAPDDVWNVMHLVGEQLGLRSGYDFKSIKDNPHFECPTWKLTQADWKAGKIKVA